MSLEHDLETYKIRQLTSEVHKLVTQGSKKCDAVHVVARDNSVSYAALHKQYFSRYPESEREHGNCLLTKVQETHLVALLMAFSGCCIPLVKSAVAPMVQNIWKIEVSDSWVDRFLAKFHMYLKQAKSKRLSKHRFGENVLVEVAQWLGDLQAAQDVISYTCDNVFNYDETRVVAGFGGDIRIERIDKDRPCHLSAGYRVLASLVSFVGADGRCWLSVYIFPGTPRGDDIIEVDIVLPNELPYTLRGSWPRFMAFSESGYVTTEICKKILEKFCETWNGIHPGLLCYLFSDQLSSHRDVGTRIRCLEKNVMCWLFPANCSHWIQPLDAEAFAQCKNEIRRNFTHLAWASFIVDFNLQDTLFLVMYYVERQIFSNDRLVRRSFCSTGIFPFDEVKIMNNALHANGKYAGQSRDPVFDSARVMTTVLNNFRENIGVPIGGTRKSGRISKRALFSPLDLKDRESVNDLNKAAKLELMQTQHNEVLKRKIDRENRKCLAPECTAHNCGGKQWAICVECGRGFCPKHRHSMDSHNQTCVMAQSSVVINTIPTE